MENKKVVLQIGLANSIGGIESMLFQIYKAIDKRDVDFEFVSYNGHCPLESQLLEMGAMIHVMPRRKTPLAVYRFFSDLFKERRYDAVHFHKNSAANPIPILVARMLGMKRICIHSHNTMPSRNEIVTRLAHYVNRPILYALASSRVACSESAGRWMFGAKAVETEKVQILHNGIDFDRFAFREEIRHEVRRELGIADEEAVIGHIGRFSQAKNHFFLLDAFDKLRQSHPKAKLLLVGDGALRESVQQKASALHLDGSIIFAGRRMDVEKMYWAMDVFVMPSLYEGLPVAVLEAQASGLPCVLSKNIAQETKMNAAFVRFLPLELGPEKWADEIAAANALFASRDRAVMADAAWDIHNIADKWRHLYE